MPRDQAEIHRSIQGLKATEWNALGAAANPRKRAAAHRQSGCVEKSGLLS